jgi:hypothetical protein
MVHKACSATEIRSIRAGPSISSGLGPDISKFMEGRDKVSLKRK